MAKMQRDKGAKYERLIASKFKKAFGVDLVRTPQSGGFAKKSVKADEFRGDIVSADKDIELALHIECKNHKKWTLSLWLQQAMEDCPKYKIPAVVFHKHNTSDDYIAMNLEDFFKIADKDKIIKEIKNGR